MNNDSQRPTGGGRSLEDVDRLISLAPTAEEYERLVEERRRLLEGNGHAEKKPPKVHPKLAIAVKNLERVAKARATNTQGPEPGACMLGACRYIVSGDIEEEMGKAVMLAAYGGVDGEELFQAAMEKARTEPRTIPHLTHKDALKSAHALLKHLHTESEVVVLRRYQEVFHRWDGTAYRPVEDVAVERDVWNFLPLGEVIPSQSRVGNVIAALRGQVHLARSIEPACWLGDPPDGYPEPKDLVPLKNGLLDPKTGIVHPHTPRLFNLSSLPFPYSPEDARPPVEWLRFLDTIWGDAANEAGFARDEQSIECLQEMFGYLLTTDTAFQKMFFIQGPKRSGKGTITRVLVSLLGKDNVAAPSLSSLSGEHGLQSLLGKTAAIIADAMVSSGTDILRVAEVLKNISGEDPVTINPKYLSEVTTTLRCRFVILGNEMPRFLDASNALSSRFIAMRLTRSFAGEEDHGLIYKLLPELPQILHWALEGRRRLYERGYFLIPDSAKGLLEDLEEASSPIGTFLKERCVVGPGESISVARLWEMWCEWARLAGHKESGKMVWFGRDLRAAIPTLEKVRPRDGESRVQTYKGVGEKFVLP